MTPSPAPSASHAPHAPHVLLSTLAALCLACSGAAGGTLDLLESYRAAMANHADLLAARAAAEAGREAQPMARAQLLPTAGLSLGHYRNDLSTRTLGAGPAADNEQRYTSRSGALVLRQPLYRPAAWAGYRRAQAMVAQAEATLIQAEQDTGLQVAQAYFDLLLAREGQLQMQTQARVIGLQLEAAQRVLAAGQGTRTDVDDAQARLDLALAREVVARDTVAQAVQELQAMVQQPVEQIRPLKVDTLRLAAPDPDQLEHWWQQAEQRSPAIAVLTAQVLGLQADIDRLAAGHRPTLDAILQRSVTDRDSIFNPGSTYHNTQVGLSLNVPLYAGGGVSAQVRQAMAALEEARYKLEAEQRQLRNEVRKAFQAVRQGVHKVQALEQAERSAQQAVVSSERGLSAGIRSRLDILNAQQQLSQAVLELARERLACLMAQVRLHALTGGLDETRIQQVNQALDLSASVRPDPYLP
jgi:outer membrane protein/protease secretion system outer membrane protein